MYLHIIEKKEGKLQVTKILFIKYCSRNGFTFISLIKKSKQEM